MAILTKTIEKNLILSRNIKIYCNGKINELVVAFKDCLTRYAYDLIEEIINKYSNGKILVLNIKKNIEPEEELVHDIMALMNVYVAKLNGLRRYKKLKNNSNCQ
jgi:predicted site-specific integrase-resolvase